MSGARRAHADPDNGGLPRRAEAYLPLAEYGLIGDTLTTALISRGGSLDRMCLPDMDSPSLPPSWTPSGAGGSSLDPPVRPPAGGSPEVTDLMPLALGGVDDSRPERRVLRLADAVADIPEIAVTTSPRPDWGGDAPDLRRLGRGTWSSGDGRDHMIVQSDIGLEQTALARWGARAAGIGGAAAGFFRLHPQCTRHCPRDDARRGKGRAQLA